MARVVIPVQMLQTQEDNKENLMYGPLSGNVPLSDNSRKKALDMELKKKKAEHDMMLKQQAATAKMAQDAALGNIKVAKEATVAGMDIRKKHLSDKAKLKEQGINLPDKIDIPTAPLAATPSVFDQIPTNPEAGPSDRIPALLAPGEAVIPAKAAQDPKNKPVVEALVNEGRQKNAQAKGYEEGTTGVWGSIWDTVKGAFSSTPSYDPKYAQTVSQLEEILKREDLDPATRQVAEVELNNIKNPMKAQQQRVSTDQKSVASEISKDPKWVENSQTLGIDNKQLPPKNKAEEAMAAEVAQLSKQPVPPTSSIADQFSKPGQTSKVVVGAGEFGSKQPGYTSWVTEMQKSMQQGKPVTNPAELTPTQARARGYDMVTGKRDQLVDKPVEIPKPTEPAVRDSSRTGVPRVEGTAEEQLKAAEPKDEPMMDTRQWENGIGTFLEQPEVKAKVAEGAAQAAKIADPKEKKSFLTRFMENLFGDSGLVNPESLSYFALLAAGGLVTGGSFAGSVRFAGAKAIENEMAQRKVLAAAEAEQAKALRNEQIQGRKDADKFYKDSEKEFNDMVAKADNVDPKVRTSFLMKVREELSKAKTAQERAAIYRGATGQIAAMVSETAKADKPTYVARVMHQGKPIDNVYRQGTTFYQMRDGQPVVLEGAVDYDTWMSNRKGLPDKVAEGVLPSYVVDAKKGINNTALAKSIGQAADNIYVKVAKNISPEEWSDLVIKSVNTEKPKTYEEAQSTILRRAVAVVTPGAAQKDYVGDINKPLSPQANQLIYNRVMRYGDGNMDKGFAELKAEFDKLSEDKKKDLRERKPVKDGQHSAFTLWLSTK